MGKRIISTTKALRQENRNRIFKFLYKNKNGCSKQDIATELKMSMPTVTQNITELMEMDLIYYCGSAQSTGGRKARLLKVNENKHYAIGVSITKCHISFVAVNLAAKKLATKKTRFDFGKCNDVSDFIMKELDGFICESNLGTVGLLGVRIAVPGIINEEKGVVEFAPTLQANPILIKNLVEKIQYPCSVENDANAGGFAELYNASVSKGVAYISLDRGVGGGIFLNNKLYAGNNNRSGELGHVCVKQGGKKCNCGSKGCLEAYCSTDRLSVDLGITLEEFFKELPQNAGYNKLWEEYLYHLGSGLEIMQAILDCDIILGGALSPYLHQYLVTLQKHLKGRYSAFEISNRVTLSKYGGDSTCVGAALFYVLSFIETV